MQIEKLEKIMELLGEIDSLAKSKETEESPQLIEETTFYAYLNTIRSVVESKIKELLYEERRNEKAKTP